MPYKNNNPYQDASNAYSNNKAASLSDPRTMEAQALLKAAAKLDMIRNRMRNEPQVSLDDIVEQLDYNKKLWIVFADSAADNNHPLPQEIKNNIASLAIFMFKRTIDMMADPLADKLDVMIDINRQIASGLMKKPPKDDNPSMDKPVSSSSRKKENQSTSAVEA